MVICVIRTLCVFVCYVSNVSFNLIALRHTKSICLSRWYSAFTVSTPSEAILLYSLLFHTQSTSISTVSDEAQTSTHHSSVITGRCGVVCSLTAHVTLLMRLESWHLDDSQPSAQKYLWRLLCSIPGLVCSSLLVYMHFSLIL